MPHFYIPPEQINDNIFRITGEDVHYLITVRRYGVGDKIKIFDGKGSVMLARIDSVSRDEIKGAIIGANGERSAGVKLNIYTAVPKGKRFDWFIEKAAELGVSTIAPIVTERSAVREISAAKFERLQRLSKAASQQCCSQELLKVEKMKGFEEALKYIPASALNLIPWEAEETKTLKDVYNCNAEVKEINVFIGPEGGFTVGEIELAKKYKLVPVTLGERILRVETAGIVSAVLILQFFGDHEKR